LGKNEGSIAKFIVKEFHIKQNRERFMKVTSIFGGPRKKGNTATVLGWVEAELKSQGQQVERINLTSKKLNGCISCYKCKDNHNEPGCVQKDDGPFIIDQMVASDIVIYASPLYYWGLSSQMKALIDRCYCLYRGACGTPEHTSFVEGQRQALIVTAADPFENNAEQVLMAFQRMLVYNKTHSAGELLVCNSTTPEELGEKVKEQAIKFANQLFAATQTPYALLIPGGALKLVPEGE
jgi:multimeric flavodoxin WrbA